MAVIPTGIPKGIQREFALALERTGWTPELLLAAHRLQFIFKMTPEDFEKFSAPTYQRIT